MAIVNKYDNPCSTCQHTVHAGEGVAVEYEGEWYAYHNTCIPTSLGNQAPVAKAAPASTNCITENGEVFITYNPAHIELIKTIPNRQWNKAKNCWTFPLVKASIDRAVEVGRLLSLNIAESLKAGVQETKKCKNYSKLFDYQKEGADFLSSRSVALLGDEMGTGKTIQTLCALPANARVLIVCPSSLKLNWVKEANKWRPDYQVAVLSSSKIQTEYEATILVGKDSFRLPEQNEILILNRELLPDFLIPSKPVEGKQYMTCDLPEEFTSKLHEVCIVVDEAHQFKGTKTAGHKKMRTLSRNAKSTWALTGTPLLSRPTDLWGVLASCNMEKIVFNKYGTRPYDYFKDCFNGIDGRFGINWGEPRKEVPDLMSRVRLARKRADVLKDLPNKIYTDIMLSFDNSDGSVIKKQLDDLNEKFGQVLSNGNLPPLQSFSTIRSALAKSRIPAMLEYVEDCEEQEVPLVIFSVHKAPFDALRLRDGWEIIDGDTKVDVRQRIVDDFQNGKLKGVGCTIQAGGVGITLTHAWKCLFVDLDWTPAFNSQAESRLIRIGQESKKVEIVRFVNDHPLDRRIFELLSQKETLVSQTFDKQPQSTQAEDTLVEKTKGKNYVEVICEYESARSSKLWKYSDIDFLMSKANEIVTMDKNHKFYPLVSRTDVRAINNLVGKYQQDPLFEKALSLIVGRYQLKFEEHENEDI